MRGVGGKPFVPAPLAEASEAENRMQLDRVRGDARLAVLEVKEGDTDEPSSAVAGDEP
jgi:hypothetical protein